MKIVFLLPPSEWKNSENKYDTEELTFNLEKPFNIACNVSEKDLKCIWSRYDEWITLNKNIKNSWTLEAINRYSWVMYNSINYSWMNKDWKKFFEDNFIIFSWMYWLVKPLDNIWNYKLPIESKWLYDYWWNNLPKAIKSTNPDYIVNLLPISYSKLIWLWVTWWKHKEKLEDIMNWWTKIININFLKPDWKKISHWVKKIKWEWVKDICEKWITNLSDFWLELIDNNNVLDINIIH